MGNLFYFVHFLSSCAILGVATSFQIQPVLPSSSSSSSRTSSNYFSASPSSLFPTCSPQSSQTSTVLHMMEVWCACFGKTTKPPTPPNGNSLDAVLVGEDSPIPEGYRRFPYQWIVVNENRRLTSPDGTLVGTSVKLEGNSSKGQDEAIAALGSVSWVLVSSDPKSAWQMIPAENILATSKSTGTKVAFTVNRASDVGGLARALELGVDALCVPVNASQEVWDAVWEAQTTRQEQENNSNEALSNNKNTNPQVVVGNCWGKETKTTVIADRVCVDLVQTLSTTEGCWVGSSAKTLALVLSEAATSDLVPSRPFRVNAGPIHSYILMGDETTTKYLCELGAADTVSVYDAATGKSRAVAVGRIKTEVRPCVMVELEKTSKDNDNDELPSVAQVFLQQAETVRLGQPNGDYVRVTELDMAQDHQNINKHPILLRVSGMGTHIGKGYSGKVDER